jgi:hypothetical protein
VDAIVVVAETSRSSVLDESGVVVLFAFGVVEEVPSVAGVVVVVVGIVLLLPLPVAIPLDTLTEAATAVNCELLLFLLKEAVDCFETTGEGVRGKSD